MKVVTMIMICTVLIALTIAFFLRRNAILKVKDRYKKRFSRGCPVFMTGKISPRTRAEWQQHLTPYYQKNEKRLQLDTLANDGYWCSVLEWYSHVVSTYTDRRLFWTWCELWLEKSQIDLTDWVKDYTYTLIITPHKVWFFNDVKNSLSNQIIEAEWALFVRYTTVPNGLEGFHDHKTMNS